MYYNLINPIIEPIIEPIMKNKILLLVAGAGRREQSAFIFVSLLNVFFSLLLCIYICTFEYMYVFRTISVAILAQG